MGSLIGHRWVFFCPIVRPERPEPCEQCNKVVGFIRVYVDRGLQLCFTAASHNLPTKQHKSDSGKNYSLDFLKLILNTHHTYTHFTNTNHQKQTLDKLYF